MWNESSLKFCLDYTVEQILLFFFLRALEKVSFVWHYFRGTWYFLVLLNVFSCIGTYCNDGGPMKRFLGTFVARLHN